MQRIKLFYGKGYNDEPTSELEKEVNDFCATVDVVSIQYQPTITDLTSIPVICVVYKAK